jgi:hypothetical protein
MAFPIPASGLSVVALKTWALRVYSQLPGGPISESVHEPSGWAPSQPIFKTVPLSPLASVAWGEGKEVSTRARFRYAA